ncbi:MAG: VacB/RNase II family 3'-5' exoribonuclease [Polyangiales bacterium]
MPSPTLDDAAILAALRDSAHRPHHVNDLARTLDVPFTQRHVLSEALDALVARGLVAAMPGSRYRLPRVAGARVEGHYTHHPRGFGFVTTGDGGEDVFIPATGTLGAMHGDLVAVTAQKGDRGREGVVVEVLTRRAPTVPGTLRLRPRGAWVEPDDARIRGPIMVEDAGDAADGASVVCEVTRWPDHPGEAPVGRVRETLGAPGALDTEVRKVLLREGVEESFPAEAAAEAAGFGADPTPAEMEGRVDLRATALVTIDPDDARDHDDAVHVAQRPDGGYTATVAIADVSHYVRPGTALDAAALGRGTSIYLPDRAIPMLPRELSSTLASLLPDRDRLVLAAVVELAPDGEVESSRVVEGVMRSHARLTYTDVARALGWSEGGRDASRVSDSLLRDLGVASDLATVLRRRRMKRGALDLDLPEPRVRFEEDGRTPATVVQSRRDPGVKRAYQLIEELMLLANEVVAGLCVAEDIPAVYRVHGQPDEEHLSRFAAVADAYGYKVDVEAGRAPKKLAAVLRKAEGKPEARVLGMLLLRALPQARYASVNLGHFGLASNAYLHFTSPIRRYPDVAVHRAVRAHLRGEKAAGGALVARAAAESSRLERRAMDVEREVLDLYRCEVAKKHLGEVHAATVTGASANGPYVDIDDPFLSGIVKLEGSGDGAWELDELGVSVTHGKTGRVFALGDPLTVEIVDALMLRRQVVFGLTREEREAMARMKRPKGKAKGKGFARGDDRGKGRGRAAKGDRRKR